MASSPCSDTVEKCIDGISKSTSAEETCVGVIKLILTGAWSGVGRTTVKGATIAVRAVGNNPSAVVTSRDWKAPAARDWKVPTARDWKVPTARNWKAPTSRDWKVTTARNREVPTSRNWTAPTARDRKAPTARNRKAPTAGNWRPLTTTSRTSFTASIITANTVFILSLTMLSRWSSEGEGGESEGGDGFDKLHGVEESGKTVLLSRR